MPADRAWVEFDEWRSRRVEAIFRKMDRLLDELPDHPELAEQTAVQLQALMRDLREIEKAKPPG
jgi:hypothetical protein